MLTRAQALASQPEFYNTHTNTCTTNLVRHVNTIAPGRIPLRPAVFLPAYSHRLLYDLGLIRTGFPYEETRALALINERAQTHDTDPDFSRAIRTNHPLIAPRGIGPT